VIAAERAGATVRWVEFDKETAELTVDHVRAQLSDRTRLVAVTGPRTSWAPARHPAVAEAVHAVGACSTSTACTSPARPGGVQALGADFYACSPYKFLGPTAARSSPTRAPRAGPARQAASLVRPRAGGSSSAPCPTS